MPRDGLAPRIHAPAFTLAEAKERGVAAWRTRGSDILAPSRGIRLRSDVEPSLLERARVHAAVTPFSVISHSTAAALWGIWLPWWLDGHSELHVTRPHRFNAQRRRGVIGHNGDLSLADVRRLGNVPLTSPAWTWMDLAGMVERTDLIIAGDCLLRRSDAPARAEDIHPYVPDPLCSVAELERMVRRRRNVHGVRLAREVLPLLRHGVDSRQETRLRLVILAAGLPEPVVNEWILDASGRRVSRPDLQYPRQRVALEYEGDGHRTDARQWGRDIERDDRLRAMGWIVLRFSKYQLSDEGLPASLAKIRRALER